MFLSSDQNVKLLLAIPGALIYLTTGYFSTKKYKMKVIDAGIVALIAVLIFSLASILIRLILIFSINIPATAEIKASIALIGLPGLLIISFAMIIVEMLMAFVLGIVGGLIGQKF